MISSRDGLVGSKRDHLNSLLRSRKRKLAQLYDVTAASYLNPDFSRPDALSKFLELNDIDKGRPFDEATLPQFPPTYHSTTTTSSIHLSNSPGLLDASSSSLSHPDSRQSAPSTAHKPQISRSQDEASQIPATTDSDAPSIAPTPPSSLKPSDVRTSSQRRSSSRTRPPDSGPILKPPDELPAEDWEAQRIRKKVESPQGSPGVDPSKTEADDRQARPPLSIPGEGSDAASVDNHLQVGHRHHHHQQHHGASSPSSTVGPDSAHTPRAGPASDTSPEEDNQGDDFQPPPQKRKKGSSGGDDNDRRASPHDELSPADQQLHLESSRALSRPELSEVTNNSKSSPFAAPPPAKTNVDNRKALPPLQTSRYSKDAETPTEPFPSLVATPVKAIPSTARSPPERMTTRVSSGALRQRSVSEILGGPIEKPAPAATEPMVEEPESIVNVSPMSRLPDKKERDRLKHSTVVFGGSSSASKKEPHTPNGTAHENNEDYLLTLFVAQASVPPRAMQLNALMSTAAKIVTTSELSVDLHEQQDCRILKKIYQLQYSQRWPLRQMARSREPPRQPSHWDAVLGQMKWMRADFREERKWKMMAAKNLADTCACYVNSQDETVRASLRVHIRRPSNAVENQSTPDLVDGSSVDDSGSDNSIIAPAAIFSLPANEIMFEMKKFGFSQKLLSELPLYEPAGIASLPAPLRELPDLCPISKFIQGRIVLDAPPPPRRQSRYDFDPEGDDADDDDVEEGSAPLPPERGDVALFNPDSRHVLDRIHSGHAFRPPSEFVMPTIQFYESRNSSQWTPVEDKELRSLVKEYQYNWSLISSILTPSTLYTSGAERRTPWECFERWIGLEGLPAEMQKTAYFRTYSNRLATAQRNVLREHERQTQQDRQNGPSQPVRRQRTIQPLRVDRRKQTKHLAVLDAMRKQAKKRETTAHNKRDVSNTALQKAQAAAHARPPANTPAEFSRIKYEREMKFQEHYKNELLKHKTAAAMQNRVTAQAAAVAAANHAPQQQQQQQQRTNGVAVANSAAAAAVAAVAQQGRAQLGGQAGLQNNNLTVPNGNMPGANSGQFAMQYKGMPQAPMQNGMSGQQRFPNSPDSRILTDAQRVQLDQRRLAEQQRNTLQQQMVASMRNSNAPQSGPSSSPNMTNATAVLQQNLAALQQGLAAQTNGYAAANASRMANVPSHFMSPAPQQLSSGHVPAINNIHHMLKSRNPDLSQEQIHRLANEHLTRSIQQQAMNSAAGVRTSSSSPPQPSAMLHHSSQHQHHNSNGSIGSSSGSVVGGMLASNVNEYNRQIRAQQASQSGGSSSAGRPSPMPGQRPDSRGGGGGGGGPGSVTSQQSPQMGMATPQQTQTQASG